MFRLSLSECKSTMPFRLLQEGTYRLDGYSEVTNAMDRENLKKHI